MLFIIAEEVLSRGLSSLVQCKELQAIHGQRGVATPGHILFADDIFIFTNASLRYVRTLKNFLMKYQEFLGQCISLKKSKLFLGKIAPDRKKIIVDTLGIQIYNFPTRYLGVEIFKGRVKKEALLPVMDKVKGRLAGWKGNLLSLAGRTELVRSAIAGIPNHSFAIYWWPTSLLATIERWMRNFIWTGGIEFAKKITIKWDALCKPKEEGGLGIRRLKDTNKAMLCKLVWRIKHEKTVANSFLKARFIKNDGSLKKGVSSSIVSGVKKVWSFVEENQRWIIGNGNLVNFWKDKWWGPKSVLEELQIMDLTALRFNAKVGDFIRGGEWVFREVSLVELIRIFDKLKRIKIPSANIWWERNRRRHDNEYRAAMQIFEYSHQELGPCIGKLKGEVKAPIDVIFCSKLGLTVGSHKHAHPLEVHWCKPQPNWLKVNVDGSSLGNPGRAEAGGIV
ncbi:uncharacterized protein LOC122060672 [Macadamia integrifolia]|uniref:uncharacterized protein LOC122060672 n=1 Tax=Macadamia integrifolia TaxID=60698 RepID=UPI001C5340F3|nr:uncharacterized protein LOC122060672 [Macadamia integrifolia]